MIARHWRGWTHIRNADVYETLLKNNVLPGLKNIKGYKGGYILRSNGPNEAEFVVVNFFDSLDAVKRFAGKTTLFLFSNPKRESCYAESSRLQIITRFAPAQLNNGNWFVSPS